MTLLRLVIGVPLTVIGLFLLLGSVGMWMTTAMEARAGAVVMDVIGLVLVWAGRRLTQSRKRDDHCRTDPASEKQKSFARELGIRFDPGISKRELSDKISKATGNDWGNDWGDDDTDDDE